MPSGVVTASSMKAFACVSKCRAMMDLRVEEAAARVETISGVGVAADTGPEAQAIASRTGTGAFRTAASTSQIAASRIEAILTGVTQSVGLMTVAFLIVDFLAIVEVMTVDLADFLIAGSRIVGGFRRVGGCGEVAAPPEVAVLGAEGGSGQSTES